MTITKITNHIEQAKARLIQQFKEKTNIESIIEVFGQQAQAIEDTLIDLLNNRSIDTATQTNLDRIGATLNEQRFGLSDANYRIVLYAKIARNFSEGTPEDLIRIYKLLVQADKVLYAEGGYADVYLTALNPQFGLSGEQGTLLTYAPYFAFFGDNGTNSAGFGNTTDPNAGGFFSVLAPNTVADVGDLARIRAAVEGAKPAGVALVILSIQQKPYFVFEGDPDPDGEGFASTAIPGSGGRFSIIL